MDLLEVGKIVNTHGLKGEVKVVPWTDTPDVFEMIEHIYLKSGDILTVKGIKYQKNNIIVKFSEISDIDDALKFKGQVISADRSELGELPDGVYYIADIIGMKVISDVGEDLGEVSDVIQTGANDIYEVKREGKKSLLLPVIDDVILGVDTEKRIITAHLLEGLAEL